MKRIRIFIGLLLTISLIASLMPVPAFASPPSGAVYTVKQDGSGDFATIQAAADIAQPGDTIIVSGGIYREEVVLPRGGTGEDARITLKVAAGEEVVVTGSDKVQPGEWVAAPEVGPGVYKLVKPNTYFPGHRENRGDRLPGWTCDLDQFNPFNSFWRSRANSSSPSSGGLLGYVSCGQVYLNGEPMNQRWSLNGEAGGITNGTFGTVAAAANTWIAYVDVINDGVNPITTSPNGNPDMSGFTTIYANFGAVDPTDPANDTEINVRMQCLTAEWNLGYITFDGFTVMRGAGPKTVDFWQMRAEGMFGAISTNGGYKWVIENCDVSQCRGVAIDFGNGSRGQEERYGPGYDYGDWSDNTPGGYNGNGPEIYGNHTIRYCNIFDNATNGMFAYRGAYSEIYGCAFINNNCINTGLASEAYFKDVSGGFGIKLHDNYFYSDQSWTTMPIWMDCECDDVVIANNVVYSPSSGGFSNISYELNAGWNLLANNIIINCGISNGVNGNVNVVNNLLIGTGNYNVIGSASQNRAGAEGGNNRTRTNRVVVPGTLDEISTVGNPTSRFEPYSRYNKFMGNILFWSTSPNNSGTNYDESQRVTGYGEFVLKRQDECAPGHVSMPDFSGGVASFHAGLPDVVALQNAGTVFDWAWVYAAGTAGNSTISRTVYGNMADWNVLYGVSARPSGWDSRGFEQNGVVVPSSAGNNYTINASKESFSITLDVDNSAIDVNPPLFTSEFMGPSDMKQNLGYLSYPPSVEVDIRGVKRDFDNNVAGPFADLQQGVNTFDLWPNIREKAYVSITGSPTVTTGAGASASYTISAKSMPLVSGIELEFEVDGNYLSSKDFTAMGGFSFIGDGNYSTPITWKNVGNIWTGKVTLVNLGSTAISGGTDILGLTFNVPEGALGDTTIKLNYVKMSYGGDQVSVILTNDSFTTVFDKYYSPYDLNKDDVIDLNDLTFALQYLLVDSTMPEWEQAKVCNFDDTDEVITINDLILILANYTIPYYS